MEFFMAQLKAGVGASDTLFQHDRPNNVKRSRFDLSRFTNFTADPGMIIPFDWFLCLPGDDVDIDFEFILDTLPLINPSLTSYKVLTHWYAIDLKHLWEGWETFITRGRSGNVNLQIPQISTNYLLASGVSPSSLISSDDKTWFDSDGNPLSDSDQPSKYDIYPESKHSLSSFLGVPPVRSGIFHGIKTEINGAFAVSSNFKPYTLIPYNSNITTAQSNALSSMINTGFHRQAQVSALPFMAYQNIVKYNYVNQNLLQNNHSLFPVKGDHDWFLPYDATTTNFIDYPSNSAAEADTNNPKTFRYDGVFTEDDTVTRLDQLRYAMFDDDYFTTGLPWLQRGDVTEAGIDISIPDDLFNISAEAFTWLDTTIPVLGFGLFGASSVGAVEGVQEWSGEQRLTGRIPTTDEKSIIKGLFEKLKVVHDTSKSLRTSLTANQLREMLAMSVWQERNARVNGSYNAMIYQHWRTNPHGEEHKPLYIGGTADYVNFATILQSSQSSESSPLGATAGRGSTGGSAKVGHYHANDYSYVFGIMIIKPNTTYMQGIEHHLTEKVFDDFVQPEFEGLSPEPILNKELYVSGDSSDNDLFCYQERYVYLKVRQNVNRGMFQCKPDKDRLFGSFTQARWFDSKPTFSYQFLCMSPDNLRRDWLAYPSQPAFKLQTASKVFVTRSLSYTSQPETFGF